MESGRKAHEGTMNPFNALFKWINNIKPETITEPFPFLVLWVVMLVLLLAVGMFSAPHITGLPQLLAFLFPLALAIIVFTVTILMLVRYRDNMLPNKEWAALRRAQLKFKHDFKPDAKMAQQPVEAQIVTSSAEESWPQRELRRKEVYEKHRGLFLIYTAWP